MKSVQCYELFGGIALKNLFFSYCIIPSKTSARFVLNFYYYHPTADLSGKIQKSLQWDSLQYRRVVADLCMFYELRNNLANIDIPPILVPTVKHNCNYNHIQSIHSIQSYISDVKAWATVNMLKLNENKTELMLVTSKRTKHLHNLPTSITIGNAQVPFKQSVKNLGFTLDCHLTMNAHVANIARTCHFELRHFGIYL